ncbi:transposase InsO family protein [Aurantimonas endophytica]|uniref:Transposase InsO family protein n=1 Tax=Aurantimonas endophytica TaxID=1522175 RepID=A0A7W6HDF6_9HYPH|nr:transposase InsO family protein [Aurantimonas endophytica]
MIAETTGAVLIAAKIFGVTAPIAIERVVATTIASGRGSLHSAGRTLGLLSVIGTAAETGADPNTGALKPGVDGGSLRSPPSAHIGMRSPITLAKSGFGQTAVVFRVTPSCARPSAGGAHWKIERTARKTYRTRDQAKADVFDYIERFYNPTRRHSTLGHLSPMDFEKRPQLA